MSSNQTERLRERNVWSLGKNEPMKETAAWAWLYELSRRLDALESPAPSVPEIVQAADRGWDVRTDTHWLNGEGVWEKRNADNDRRSQFHSERMAITAREKAPPPPIAPPPPAQPAPGAVQTPGEMAEVMTRELVSHPKNIGIGNLSGTQGATLFLPDFTTEMLSRTRQDWRDFITAALTAQREAGSEEGRRAPLHWHWCGGKVSKTPAVYCSKHRGVPPESDSFEPVAELERLRAERDALAARVREAVVCGEDQVWDSKDQRAKPESNITWRERGIIGGVRDWLEGSTKNQPGRECSRPYRIGYAVGWNDMETSGKPTPPPAPEQPAPHGAGCACCHCEPVVPTQEPAPLEVGRAYPASRKNRDRLPIGATVDYCYFGNHIRGVVREDERSRFIETAKGDKYDGTSWPDMHTLTIVALPAGGERKEGG